MRLHILSSILLALLSVQGHLHAAAPIDSFALDGLVSVVPLGAGWHRLENTSQRADFERNTDGQRITLSLSAHPIEPLPDDQAFLRFAEDRQIKALSKLEKVSVHYNRTQKKGAPCLTYDGIFHDKAAQASPFLSFRGMLCRHSGFAEKLIQVELAQRSNTKEDAYRVSLLEMAEQVFSAVQFTELPRSRAAEA